MTETGKWSLKPECEARGVDIVRSIAFREAKANGSIRNPVVDHLRVKLYAGCGLADFEGAVREQEPFGDKKLVEHVPVPIKIESTVKQLWVSVVVPPRLPEVAPGEVVEGSSGSRAFHVCSFPGGAGVSLPRP